MAFNNYLLKKFMKICIMKNKDKILLRFHSENKKISPPPKKKKEKETRNQNKNKTNKKKQKK